MATGQTGFLRERDLSPSPTNARKRSPSPSSSGYSPIGHSPGTASTRASTTPIARALPEDHLNHKVFDKNVSNWASKVRVTKIQVDGVSKDVEALKGEVKQAQAEVDLLAVELQKMESRFLNELLLRVHEVKASYEGSAKQKVVIEKQLSTERKSKTRMEREKKMLASDYKRRHSELLRTIESHEKLEVQVAHLTQSLGQIGEERRKGERELQESRQFIRKEIDLAEEVNHKMADTLTGMHDAVDHMSHSPRHGATSPMRGLSPNSSAANVSPVSPHPFSFSP